MNGLKADPGCLKAWTALLNLWLPFLESLPPNIALTKPSLVITTIASSAFESSLIFLLKTSSVELSIICWTKGSKVVFINISSDVEIDNSLGVELIIQLAKWLPTSSFALFESFAGFLSAANLSLSVM